MLFQGFIPVTETTRDPAVSPRLFLSTCWSQELAQAAFRLATEVSLRFLSNAAVLMWSRCARVCMISLPEGRKTRDEESLLKGSLSSSISLWEWANLSCLRGRQRGQDVNSVKS